MHSTAAAQGNGNSKNSCEAIAQLKSIEQTIPSFIMVQSKTQSQCMRLIWCSILVNNNMLLIYIRIFDCFRINSRFAAIDPLAQKKFHRCFGPVLHYRWFIIILTWKCWPIGSTISICGSWFNAGSQWYSIEANENLWKYVNILI